MHVFIKQNKGSLQLNSDTRHSAHLHDRPTTDSSNVDITCSTFYDLAFPIIGSSLIQSESKNINDNYNFSI